jgi:hypothetical protein
VVEWGGGLVEGLAADRLDVTIALAPPTAVPQLADQEPRTVRLEGHGPRWDTPDALPPAGGTTAS